MFNIFFDRFSNSVFSEIENFFNEKNTTQTFSKKIPNTNIYNLKNCSKIVLEMPGLTKNEISMNVNENNILEINGKNCFKTFDNAEINIEEIKFCDYQRTFKLNEKYDINKIEANFENGLLLVTIPLKEKEKNSKIEIKIN